jgi:hypothetical protein
MQYQDREDAIKNVWISYSNFLSNMTNPTEFRIEGILVNVNIVFDLIDPF